MQKNSFVKSFFVIVVFFSIFFNRNPFLQLREGVRIEIGYFLELVSPIKCSIPKGRGGESGKMISILHRDVPASYYRVP